MEIKIHELSSYLDSVIPRSLSCEWDNDGVMVCADTGAPVRRVLFSLDVTMGTLEYANFSGCNTVISHHPLVFRPLRSLSPETCSSRAAIYAVKNGINVLSYHTRLDALHEYGVNDTLVKLLDVAESKPFGPEGEEIGRIGHLRAAVPFCEFCRRVKSTLNANTLITVDAEREVETIAILGGDGKDYLMPALRSGADTFLTGRCGYNLDIDAGEYGINVIEAGHYNTEAPVLKSLERLISLEFAGVEFEYYNSDATRAV